MDLNLFATQITQLGANTKGGSALLGTGGLGQGLKGANGAAFWDVILGNLGENAADPAKNKLSEFQTQTDSGETGVLKKEKADLALLQLALMGQDADKTLEEKLSELRIERLSQNEENRVQQLTKLIEHLTGGLPDATSGESASTIEELVARLTQRLEKLESSLDAFRTGNFADEGAPFQALIATGLSPTQITKITTRIEEVETKLGRELTVDDLIAGVGNIIPVPGDEDEELSTADALSLIIDQNNKDNLTAQTTTKNTADQTQTNAEKANDISAEMLLETITENGDNIIADGAEGEETIENTTETTKENIGQIISENVKDLAPGEKRNFVHEQVTNMLAAMQVAPAGKPFNALSPANGNDAEAAQEMIESVIPQNLSNAEFNALFKDGGMNNGINNAINKLNAGKGKMGDVMAPTNLPTLPNTGTLTLPASFSGSDMAQTILSETLGFDIETGTPFSNVMQAAHAVTSANTQAGQTHPATSMVAAQISKAAQNSDTTRMTLQLDPPELGRVEVRLEFGLEKSVKAHLIVEKPETLLMLQRDMQALEKALQDAGLETDSGSLNYEMASDDYAFNSNGDGNGSNGQSGGSSDNGDVADEEIALETTMTWDVDPETGHVHYNIMA